MEVAVVAGQENPDFIVAAYTSGKISSLIDASREKLPTPPHFFISSSYRMNEFIEEYEDSSDVTSFALCEVGPIFKQLWQIAVQRKPLISE